MGFLEGNSITSRRLRSNGIQRFSQSNLHLEHAGIGFQAASTTHEEIGSLTVASNDVFKGL